MLLGRVLVGAAHPGQEGRSALHHIELRQEGGTTQLVSSRPPTAAPEGFGVPYFQRYHDTRSGERVVYVSDQTRGLLRYVVDRGTGALALSDDGEAVTIAADDAVTPSSGGSGESGSGACCFVLDPTERYLLAANYTAGSVAALGVGDNGSLSAATVVHHGEGFADAEDYPFGPEWGEHPKYRQGAPHPHGVAVDSTGTYALFADLGSNAIHSYRIVGGAAGAAPQLEPVAKLVLQPHAGPRHIEFGPDGRFAYTVNELDNTLSVLRFNSATGTVALVQTVSAVPEGWEESGPRRPTEVYSKGNHVSELLISHDGRFAHASNRGHDTVAVYAIGQSGAEEGWLTAVQWAPTGGRIPWAMCFAGEGERYVVVVNTHTEGAGVPEPLEGPGQVVALRRDAETGLLEETGATLPLDEAISICEVPLDAVGGKL